MNRMTRPRPRELILVACLFGFGVFFWFSLQKSELQRQRRAHAMYVRVLARVQFDSNHVPAGTVLDVLDGDGKQPYRISEIDSDFIWAMTPKSGPPITRAELFEDGTRFFAYSSGKDPSGRRAFFFPSPINLTFVTDDQVDWELQTVNPPPH